MLSGNNRAEFSRCFGQVVSSHAFYSKDPSSNHADLYNDFIDLLYDLLGLAPQEYKTKVCYKGLRQLNSNHCPKSL